MAGTRTRIVLELEAVDGSLAGRAQTPDGTVREFSGWLGLLEILQALVPDAVPCDRIGHGERGGSDAWAAR